MRKKFPLRFISIILFVGFVILLKQWFNIGGVLFAIGAVVGLFLPYLDFVAYLYFLEPTSALSIETKKILKSRNFFSITNELYLNPAVRSKLVFHTGYFYILILILTIFVVTSSASLFGRGMILSFTLSLLFSQVFDFVKTDDLKDWYPTFANSFDKERKLWYFVVNFIGLILLSIFK